MEAVLALPFEEALFPMLLLFGLDVKITTIPLVVLVMVESLLSPIKTPLLPMCRLYC